MAFRWLRRPDMCSTDKAAVATESIVCLTDYIYALTDRVSSCRVTRLHYLPRFPVTVPPAKAAWYDFQSYLSVCLPVLVKALTEKVQLCTRVHLQNSYRSSPLYQRHRVKIKDTGAKSVSRYSVHAWSACVWKAMLYSHVNRLMKPCVCTQNPRYSTSLALWLVRLVRVIHTVYVP